MKILMVCDFFAADQSYQENFLTKYFRRDGHNVVVVTSMYESVFEFTKDGELGVKSGIVESYDGFTLYRQPYQFNIMNRLRKLSGLIGILESEKPDILFMHDISPNLSDLCRYKRSNKGVNLVLDYHADHTNSGRGWLSRRILHGIVRRRILAASLPYIDRIMPIVPASADFLNELYGVSHESMTLLPLGVDLHAQESVKRSGVRQRLRILHGIGESDIVIFTGGKFHPYKQTEKLINALRLLDLPNVHLVVVGADAAGGSDYGNALEALANDTPRVTLTGWLSTTETYEYMAIADFAVFPASQSVLWQQCIGMGLPLVLGRIIAPGQRLQDVEYLNREDNILVLDPAKDVTEELVRSVRLLATDKELRERMAAGAERVGSHYLAWDRIARQALDVVA